MTLLFADGFEKYATTNDVSVTAAIAPTWLNLDGPGPVSSAGRLGGKAVYLNYGEDQYGNRTSDIRTANGLITPITSGIIGVGFKVNTAGPGAERPLIYTHLNGVIGLSITLSTTRILKIKNGGTVLGTWPTAIVANTWYYLELKFTLSNAGAGALEMRLDGFSGIIVTGITTGSATTMGGIQLACHDDTFVYYDDVYICSQAGTYNNDFLGNFRTQLIVPTGAGSTTSWTPSAGSNFGAVDEIPPNGATDYVSTSVADNVDLYAFSDPTIAGNIVGIAQNYLARKVTGNTDVTSLVRIAGTNYEGATKTLTDPVNFLPTQDIRERVPSTNAAWDLTNLAAAEFGVKKK